MTGKLWRKKKQMNSLLFIVLFTILFKYLLSEYQATPTSMHNDNWKKQLSFENKERQIEFLWEPVSRLQRRIIKILIGIFFHSDSHKKFMSSALDSLGLDAFFVSFLSFLWSLACRFFLFASAANHYYTIFRSFYLFRLLTLWALNDLH